MIKFQIINYSKEEKKTQYYLIFRCGQCVLKTKICKLKAD